MQKKPLIPSSFEAPPPLFKPVATKEKVAQSQAQPASGKSPRNTLHVAGNKQGFALADDALAKGILAAGMPDTD